MSGPLVKADTDDAVILGGSLIRKRHNVTTIRNQLLFPATLRPVACGSQSLQQAFQRRGAGLATDFRPVALKAVPERRRLSVRIIEI